jgi:hypothetical protein
VREAEARYDEARANYGKARNDIERDLRQAWQILAEDRIRLPQLQRYTQASAQVVASYRLQFSIGQRTLLDVLNAENELFAARSNQATGLYAVTAGELRVLAAMGKLLETLGVNIDATPQEQDMKQETRTAASRQPATGAEPAQRDGDKSAAAQPESGKIADMHRVEPAAAGNPQGAATAVNLRMSTTLGPAKAAP